ncbi:MAG: cold shock domain-containing protein [Candidatus Bathyarchaeota archaeon]|nr:cold shock domain-containing protein [Candidatus Bathyarchaeota archaeon]
MEGTIKFFNSPRGYGFISQNEGGKDAYVHRDDVLDSAELNEGDRVSFDVVTESRGPKAKNVKKL